MEPTDSFDSHSDGLDDPATDAFPVTASNTENLPKVTRGIYIGGAGNVNVVLKSGAQVTFAGLLAGTILPVRATQVRSTGTTATLLIGLV